MFKYAFVGPDGKVSSERNIARRLEDFEVKKYPDGLWVLRPIIETLPQLAHGETLGVPVYEVFSDHVTKTFTVNPAPADQFRTDRAEAYIAELGKSAAPDFQQTIGDVLDVLIAQVAFLTVATGNGAMPEFGAMLAKISDIKSRFPNK